MATPSISVASDMIGAIARCRYFVLKRADELLRDVREGADGSDDTLPGVSSLLMTSLEELKVAEEELREQNTRLERQRANQEECIRHYRNLFLYLPAPAFITDIYATIQEANLASAALFRRQAAYLERRPLSTLLATEYRQEFRRQLARLADGANIRDWKLIVKRVGDLPLEVHATVSTVPDVGPTGSGLLYWLVSPVHQSEE